MVAYPKSGSSETAKLEPVADDKYRFDYGFFSDLYELKIVDGKLERTKEGSDTVCIYEKKKK